MAHSKTCSGSVVPAVHLNGTGERLLSEQYSTLVDALDTAIEALHNAAPHPRDFIGPDADVSYTLARAQQTARVETLTRLRGDARDMGHAICRLAAGKEV
jgi:hypothetical protein